jgi:hypothetical protein
MAGNGIHNENDLGVESSILLKLSLALVNNKIN